MMRALYTIGIYMMILGIKLGQLKSAKAKKWVKGRKGWVEEMEEALLGEESDIIWFHVASLGEFEQGRELMVECKKQYPQKKILLTFFSPSGYEICKNTTIADYVFYIPGDLPRNVKKFLDIVKPELAIFIKYEYWFNFMGELYKRSIPFYYVAVRFRPEQYFFKPLGLWFRKHLRYAKMFFVQDEFSKLCLEGINVKNVKIAGDTRFDRVVRLLEEKKDFPIVEKFAGNRRVIVGGSIWDEDGYLMRDCDAKSIENFKWLLVPHEIKDSRINGLKKDARMEGCVLYSEIIRQPESEWEKLVNARILVINEVGMLSKLYRYGHIAYIGGGFGRGIHNTLEAAVYGLPVIFGPNYTHFTEAIDLVRIGAAFCVKNAGELGGVLRFLANDKNWEKASRKASEYVKTHAGAVDMVMRELATKC